MRQEAMQLTKTNILVYRTNHNKEVMTKETK